MNLLELFRNLYGVDQPQGCTDGEIAAVKEIFGAIPAVVEDFWRTFGRTPQLNYVQDTWILPEHYSKWTWPGESQYLILLNENQGVCRAGIRREDLSLPDPPVYTQMEEDDHPGVLKNWMEMEVTFYSNRPDNLLVIMDAGDPYQALFGAVTEESYLEMMDVMEGLGEPI